MNLETAIILAHGAGQGMDSPFMSYFHAELQKRGFHSIRFNFEYMDAKRRVPDPLPKLQARYRAVIEDVLKQHRPKRLIIGGKSLGGRVASTIAADIPEAGGLIFLGYPLHPPGKPERLRDQHLYSLHIPMLFISGSKDPFAEKALLESVVHKIGANATLQWIEGGDHSLKTRRGGIESLALAVDVIARWINKNE